MKKFGIPLILFAGVFAATLLLQKHTFIYQEFEGLFLCFGDYFASMWHTKLPVSGIIGDFLTQFYRFDGVAPAIVASQVVLAFLMMRGILARFKFDWDTLAAVLSCLLWMLIAFSPNARNGVFVLLILLALWLVTRLLPRRKCFPLRPWIDVCASVVLVACCFIVLARNESIGKRERMCAMRVAMVKGDLDGVLAAATPEACETEWGMMPFAFLALGEKGQLGDRLFTYPVQSQNDFDFCDQEDSEITLFFKTFLYEALGCPNEAVHNLSQLATTQPHGQSFFVLRRLMAENFAIGNYSLVRKYGAILSKSSTHKAYVKYYEDAMAKGTPATPDSPDVSKTRPLITHDPYYNLFLLQTNGFYSPLSVDRALCTLLLQKDLPHFTSMFFAVRDLYPRIPVHYQEALVLAGVDDEAIDRETYRSYTTIQPGTYWYYAL